MSTSDDAQRVPVVTAPGGRGSVSGDARTAARSASGARPATGSNATAPVRTQRPAAKRPGPKATTTSRKPAPGAPRKVRLTVARVDPWSVMKLAFLLSVAIGIATVVAAAVLWTLLDGMGVFTRVNELVSEIVGSSEFDLFDFVGFGRIISLSTVVAVVNVVLLTAISTLAGFLYNIASSLVGGLHLTLTDD